MNENRREFLKAIGLTGFGIFASQVFEVSGQVAPVKRLSQEHFVSATTCPTKLFYLGKSEYGDKTLSDPFMEALGEGGFQVAELAKFYHPEGRSIPGGLKSEEAARRTSAIINGQSFTTIFNSVIMTRDFIVEPDILIVEGNLIKIIDVKAKVFNGGRKDPFRTKKGKIRSGWKSDLYDIAFQKYVVQNAFPQFNISPYLMMADSSKKCPTDKLNQKFTIIKSPSGRKQAVRSNDLGDKDRESKILTKVNVDEYCKHVYASKIDLNGSQVDFRGMVEFYSKNFREDTKIRPVPRSICKDCEFQGEGGLRNGFKECWSESLGWTDQDFGDPTVLRIWDFRKKEKLIALGRIKQNQVLRKDIGPKPDGKPGISRTERQWLQVRKVRDRDKTAYIDRDNLLREMDKWVYPLHFIDFETSAPAIPFMKGMRPYEGIAFQYSHHIVYENGRIEHRGQWLDAKPGHFPNFDFVRALKNELASDNGSIFRYSSHENTYLNYIYRQLKAGYQYVDDAEELIAFIKSITSSTGRSREKWRGRRNMIDQWKLVKRYYYDPYTLGSNSIKQVLPAILNSSRELQDKYSRPIYGTSEIPSLNFTDWTWLKIMNGKIVDPYKQLPKMFQDVDEKDLQLLSNDNTLGDGGAALTAYGRLQFEKLSSYERSELKKALLKYCELDTFAMVLIYEGWKEMTR